MTELCLACGKNPKGANSKLCLGCFGKWLDYANKLVKDRRYRNKEYDAKEEFNKWTRNERWQNIAIQFNEPVKVSFD
jgi:hypothetical protein